MHRFLSAAWLALARPDAEERAEAQRRRASRSTRPPGCCSSVAASPFETHRYAMLLRVRRGESEREAAA